VTAIANGVGSNPGEDGEPSRSDPVVAFLRVAEVAVANAREALDKALWQHSKESSAGRGRGAPAPCHRRHEMSKIWWLLAAVGAALMGMRPVVEMQFMDFIACGFDQIVNMAAKLYYRNKMKVPIVIRGPSGGG